MRLFAVLLCLLLPAVAAGQVCDGRDMRNHLSAAQADALAKRMDGMPYPQGNHWIARRGEVTLHLIGTIHLFDPRLPAIATRLAPIIERADQLLVEAAPGDQDRLQAHLAENTHLVRMPGASLIERLDPATWGALAQAAQDRGIPPFIAANMQPWFLSLSLAIPPCLMAQVQSGAAGFDHMLMDRAQAAGTPITALEDFKTIIALFADQPIEEQIDALRLGILSTPQATDAMVTLIAQYFDEQHAATLPMNAVLARDWLDMDAGHFDQLFEEMTEALLYTRNRNWMPALLAAKGTTVVAVGAAHLGGTDGLLDLLAREGFALERAAF